MKRAIAILLTLALLGWLISDGRWQSLGSALSRLTPGVLLVAGLGFAASYLLRALRVYDEFRRDARGRFGACLRIVLLHGAMINIVPLRAGEAAFPFLLRQTFGTPLARAVASLVWFRLQDALVVGVIAALAWPGLPMALRIAAVGALLALAWLLPRWARAPHDWATRGLVAGKLGKLRDALAESTRHARFGWLWTASNWTVKLAAEAWLLAALLSAGLAQGVAGALGAELAGILPIQGVAGFGTYEATTAAALLPTGIRFEDGLRAALGLHLFVIAFALVAGSMAWLFPNAGPAPSAGDPASSSAEGVSRS